MLRYLSTLSSQSVILLNPHITNTFHMHLRNKVNEQRNKDCLIVCLFQAWSELFV